MKVENIKFKAKRIDDNTWVKGYFYGECGNAYIIENRQEESMLNRNITYEVDPSTVCQFTGLKDREGNDIFEHDLLTRDGTVAYKVEYVNCGYAALYKDVDSLAFNLLVLSKSCRVYGNDLDRKEGEE